VGRARVAIPAGAWLCPGNLLHETDACAGKQADVLWTPPEVSRWAGRFFQGYRRADGPAGTANYWIVLPLVFCENRNLSILREALHEALGYRKTGPYAEFAHGLSAAWQRGDEAALAALTLGQKTSAPPRLFHHLDGVKFLEHGLGCGGTRQDALALCALLAGYVNHPNVAGATVLSLGCQHAQVDLLLQELTRLNPHFTKPLHIFEQQKHASEQQLMQEALRTTFRGCAAANELRREPCPISDLVVGVECGGSDGFSGLSANPVIGHVSDLVCALGGAAVLSEFPELCGIEQSLCDRCTSPALAERFLDLMRRYQAAAAACGSGFDMNPSPGNIRDGLITDAIKSAGAAKKGGTAPIIDVLDYAEPITRRGGLTLLCTPGNDVESTTAITASGCTVILFSTGLGTPTGNPICPTLKIATHTGLATRMADLIDFDTGPVIEGTQSIEMMGEALFELTLATASGEIEAKAVGLGQDDFLPWKRGVSL
jgi:altronate hydrolase